MAYFIASGVAALASAAAASVALLRVVSVSAQHLVQEGLKLSREGLDFHIDGLVISCVLLLLVLLYFGHGSMRVV